MSLQENIINTLSNLIYEDSYNSSYNAAKLEKETSSDCTYDISLWTERKHPRGIIGKTYTNSYTGIKTRKSITKRTESPNRFIALAVENINIELPLIKEEEIEIMTKASFNNIYIGFLKGSIAAKMKNGELEFLKQQPANKHTRQILKGKMKGHNIKGKFLLMYETVTVDNRQKTSISIKDKRYIFRLD